MTQKLLLSGLLAATIFCLTPGASACINSMEGHELKPNRQVKTEKLKSQAKDHQAQAKDKKTETVTILREENAEEVKPEGKLRSTKRSR